MVLLVQSPWSSEAASIDVGYSKKGVQASGRSTTWRKASPIPDADIYKSSEDARHPWATRS